MKRFVFERAHSRVCVGSYHFRKCIERCGTISAGKLSSPPPKQFSLHRWPAGWEGASQHHISNIFAREFIARNISSFQKFRANKAVRIVRKYDEEEGRSQPRGKWLICCLFFCKVYWRLFLWESLDVKPSKHCCLLGTIRWAYGMLFCWKLGEAKLWNVNFWVL